MKRIVALDFDGVLHSYTSGWKGPIPFDPPVPGAQDFCRELLEANYEIVVFTTRARFDAGTIGVREWLKHHDFPSIMYSQTPIRDDFKGEFDRVTWNKVPADLYVDDRGFRFEGDFSAVWERIRGGTKPWNKEAR